MKQKISLVILFSLLFFNYGYSQKLNNKNMMNIKWEQGTHVIKCSEFNITKPLREIAAEHSIVETNTYSFTEYPDEKGRPVQTFPFTVEKDGLKYGNNPDVIQKTFGKSSVKAPIQNWAGQTAAGFRPFDPTGAAGLNYYIQMINATTYRIYDKTGGEILTGTLGDLWSPSTGNSGDPIVLYDKAADRWFLSQFGQSGNKMYIAISQTNDPTSSWYTYTFSSPDFPDYLKFSAWQDGYYMTANYAQKIFAFNRTKMLAGDGSAEAVYQSFSPPQSGFFVPLPADASDGVMPGAGTPCPIFSYSDNGWGGGNIDAVNIYNASVTWSGTPNMTVTSVGALPTVAFDGSYDSGWYDIPQPGTTQKLDGIGGCLMYRAQWKTWGTYNTVVLSWAVKVSSTQRGIFWCELRQDNSNQTWSIYQQGIYAPGTDYYWMSSAAMNNAGDIALCYAKANGTDTYMSLAYAGRHASDQLGTLPVAETIAQAGLGSQTSSNRDGDYSQTCLDPDGYTFWHTGEYMKSGGSAGTRVYSFRISEPDDPNNFTAHGVSTTQIDLSWDLNPNGDPALIAWSADGNFGTPVDGTVYNPGDAIPGGGIVLSYGTIPLTYNHTGLTPATTYYYKGWSYQSDNTYTNGILTQASTLTGDPINFIANGVSTSQIDLNWSLNASNDNVLVAWSSDGNFGTPVDGTAYNPDDVIPGGGTVLSYGAQTSFNHSGLNSSTKYFYKAWSNLNGTNYSPGITTDATTLCGIITSFPFTEDFEGAALPNCWSYEGTDWIYENGGHNGNPSAAHGGSYNALFYVGSYTQDVSKLVTPAMDLSNLADAQLTFWHTQANWSGDQDELRVYYKTTSGGSWSQLAVYTNNISSWTQETIILPNLSSTYYIAFEATGQYGYGVGIDDIEIDGTPACNAPTVQASNFNQTVQNLNDISISWDRGNGDAVIVLVHAASDVDENPGSGNVYTANSVFGNGDEIGTGNYVVYNGTGSSVNISGLNASTDYHFAIYEYYNTDVCYLKPALTGIAYTENATSVNSFENYGINIYPNPNNGTFNIIFSNEFFHANIKITDVSGKIILERSDLNKGQNTVKLTNVSKGIYFIHINYDNKPIVSKIIVN